MLEGTESPGGDFTRDNYLSFTSAIRSVGFHDTIRLTPSFTAYLPCVLGKRPWITTARQLACVCDSGTQSTSPKERPLVNLARSQVGFRVLQLTHETLGIVYSPKTGK